MVKGAGPRAHLRSRCVRTQRGHRGAESWSLPGSSEGPPCRHSQGDVGAAVRDQSSRRPPRGHGGSSMWPEAPGTCAGHRAGGLGLILSAHRNPHPARCRPRRGAEAVSEPQAHVGEKAGGGSVCACLLPTAGPDGIMSRGGGSAGEACGRRGLGSPEAGLLLAVPPPPVGDHRAGKGHCSWVRGGGRQGLVASQRPERGGPAGDPSASGRQRWRGQSGRASLDCSSACANELELWPHCSPPGGVVLRRWPYRFPKTPATPSRPRAVWGRTRTPASSRSREVDTAGGLRSQWGAGARRADLAACPRGGGGPVSWGLGEARRLARGHGQRGAGWAGHLLQPRSRGGTGPPGTRCLPEPRGKTGPCCWDPRICLRAGASGAPPISTGVFAPGAVEAPGLEGLVPHLAATFPGGFR